MSAAAKYARSPSARIRSTARAPRSAPRPTPTTVAPSRASRCAIASPIAPVAPVTRATFPPRLPIPAPSADGPGGATEADLHDLAGDDAVVIGHQVEHGARDVLGLQV